MLTVLFILLLLLIFVTITRDISDPTLSFINFTGLSDDEFGNLIYAIEISLTIILAISKYKKDSREDKKFYYNFNTYNNLLPLNSPQIIDVSNKNLLFLSEINKINRNTVCCYKLNMYASKNDISNSVCIPLLIKINSRIDIKFLKFSYIKIFMIDGENIIKLCFERNSFNIRVSENGYFFIGIDIFCNRSVEKKLLNGRLLVLAKTFAYDDFNKRIKKYFITDNQNISGKISIHNHHQCRSFFKYKFKIIKYKLSVLKMYFWRPLKSLCKSE